MGRCLLIDIPRLEYARALELMRGLAAARSAGQVDDALILTSHPPVITLGKRGGPDDLLLGEAAIRAQGVAVERVERGGLVTVHGPGQLMVYPVMGLRGRGGGMGVARFVRGLEEAGIQACAALGVTAQRREDHPGLWVDGGRKLASLGLAVKRGVTIHGMVIYNQPHPELFGLINPCGLESSVITSLAEVLGQPVDDAHLRDLVARAMARVFGLSYQPTTLAQAESRAGGGVPPHP